jgi:surfeit locus 1 family protein
MKRYVLLALAALTTAGFCALGVWQIERREWKLALIDRVAGRIHARPTAPPGPANWPGLNRESAEYLRVTATGHFLSGKETLITATTARGAGYWVMAPLHTEAGFIVLVNRGFVPADLRHPAKRADAVSAAERVRVTGLVRMTEPGGAFMRANAPGENRWYSRDVKAIAQAQQLRGVAPYFIDAEAQGAGMPVAGLTVVTFRNSHMTYAITWFSLALLTAAFGVLVARHR